MKTAINYLPMPQKGTIVVFLLFFFPFFYCSADTTTKEAELKAVVTLKIMKFIDWKSTGKNNTIRLGLIGEDRVSKALLKLNGKKIGTQTISIEQAKGGTYKQGQYQAIYISRFNKMNSAMKEELFSSRTILTFSESENFYRKGCTIYLKLQEAHMRFLINPSIHQHSSKIPSRVLRIALNHKELAQAKKDLVAKSPAK
jgi:hypothetical protein